MKKAPFLAVMANDHFVRLWLTQIITQTSAYMLNFILLVRIYAATHSTIALSIFLMFYMAPSLFLGLFSGALIDYWDKRKILVLTNILQGIVCLFYLLAGDHLLLLYFVVFLYSLCDEFFTPAQQAILPSVVKRERLVISNSLLMFTNQGALVFGALLGGIMVKDFPQYLPFLLISVLLLLSAKIISGVPTDKQLRFGKQAVRKEKSWHQFLADIKEGYRFIYTEPRVFYPFIFYVAAQVLAGTSVILFPALAENIFHISVYDSGFAIFLPIGLGALAGSYYMYSKIKTWGRKILISCGWLICGSSFLALALIAPQIDYPYLLSTGCMFFLGLGAVLIIVTSLLMLQENVPLYIRGRVFASLSAFLVISTYLPLFFLATITDRLGISMTVTIMGSVTFAIGLISFKIDRKHVLSNSHWS